MRILYIADSTSIHTQRWVTYFRDAGHDVAIITIGAKRKILPGVHHLANFERFYYLDPTFLSILLTTRRLVREIRPHVLHGHFVHQYGWLAALSGYHPLVITAWGTDVLGLPASSRLKLGRLLTSYTLRRADLLTATSVHLRQEMVRLGAPADRTHVIFWGVDPHLFRPDLCTRGLRARLNIPEGSPVVLSNRNHVALYNNDVVLLAMQQVLRRFPETVLIMQNSGGGLEGRLRRLADDLGIAASVRFLPQMPHQELPPLYAMSDIYVSVPSWDAGPVSLKEAMATHATPIISALPGPMEWVQDNVNGRVVPVRGIEPLGNAITELLADPRRREAFNRINRHLILEKANHANLMALVAGLYDSLAGGGGERNVRPVESERSPS